MLLATIILLVFWTTWIPLCFGWNITGYYAICIEFHHIPSSCLNFLCLVASSNSYHCYLFFYRRLRILSSILMWWPPPPTRVSGGQDPVWYSTGKARSLPKKASPRVLFTIMRTRSTLQCFHHFREALTTTRLVPWQLAWSRPCHLDSDRKSVV